MPDSPSSRSKARKIGLWALLFPLSVAAGSLLTCFEVPAAFFVGAVLCGVLFSLLGAELSLPRPYFQCAQVLIGCSVAKSMTPDVFSALASHWLVMTGMVCSTVVAGGVVGWSLTKWRILPGNTAAWGSSPGGANAMIAMAESYGADARMVAMMQYLRVLIVVLTASLVARWLAVPHPPAAPVSLTALLFQGNPAQIAFTLAIAAISSLIALRLRIPVGALLAPMIVGAALNSAGLVEFRLPYIFQIAASMLVGWFVGLGFNRGLLLSTLRKLHWIFLSAFLLIGLCAVFAWMLHHFSAYDSLTAYLATTPGGLDSVILLAMGSDTHTDVPFVVAAQTLRLFLVILTGPLVAKWICRHA